MYLLLYKLADNGYATVHNQEYEPFFFLVFKDYWMSKLRGFTQIQFDIVFFKINNMNGLYVTKSLVLTWFVF